MKIEIAVDSLPVIPLRYYRGWMIEFNPKTECFQSSYLCLYTYASAKELEKEIDAAIVRRGLAG